MGIKCEICGSSNLVKREGLFVCNDCGMKYSLEEIKNMLGSQQQVGSHINTRDTQDELKNLYMLARRAKNEDNAKNAAKYYDMILVKEPLSWEATFYSEYYKASYYSIAGMSSAIRSLAYCAYSVIDLINDNLTSQDEKISAYNEISSNVIELASIMYTVAGKHYKEITDSVNKRDTIALFSGTASISGSLYRMNEKSEAKGDFREIATNLAEAITLVGEKLNEVGKKTNDDRTKQIAVKTWKSAMILLVECFQGKASKASPYEILIMEIKRYEPFYTPPLTKSQETVRNLKYGGSTPEETAFNELKSELEAPKLLTAPKDDTNIYKLIDLWKNQIQMTKDKFIYKTKETKDRNESEELFYQYVTKIKDEELNILFKALKQDLEDKATMEQAVNAFMNISQAFGNTAEESETLLDKLTKESSIDDLKAELKANFELPKEFISPSNKSNREAIIRTWQKSATHAKEEFLTRSASFLSSEENKKVLEEIMASLKIPELQKVFDALKPEFYNEQQTENAINTFLNAADIFVKTEEEKKELLKICSKKNVMSSGDNIAAIILGIILIDCIAYFLFDVSISSIPFIAFNIGMGVAFIYSIKNTRLAESIRDKINLIEVTSETSPQEIKKELPSQVQAQSTPTIKELTIKGLEAVKNSNFQEAIQLFDQALKLNPKNSSAYFGKLMAVRKVTNSNELITSNNKFSISLENEELFKKALECANPKQKEQLEKVTTVLKMKQKKNM